MARRPGQTCSLCERGVSLKESRDDGNGGRRCKPDCEARKAADIRAPSDAIADAKPALAPRVNRRGKPTVESEAARTCRVRGCGCTEERKCDMGAGRTCCWTSADAPAEGDTCLLCAELIEAAEEALGANGGAVPEGLAATLYEGCDAPALGEDSRLVANARLGACIEIAVARRTPSKKDRPKKAAPVQAPIPGLGAARETTLPFPREPLAALPEDRGACTTCGERLTRENSSRPPGMAAVHIGCTGTPNEHSSSCDTCGAAEGEPCAWATPEPASYVHEARAAKLPVEERRALHRRATEDRIRVALDERVPGDSPVPSQEALVRSLVVPGYFDAPTLRDVLGAMIERGEVRELESDPIAGVPGAKYLRRAPGSPAVAMGRVGVREWASEAGEAAKPSRCTCDDPGEGECPAHPDDAKQAAARAEDDRAYHEALAAHDVRDTEADESGHAHTPTPPPPGVVPCEVCDPNGGGCDHEGEPGHRAAAESPAASMSPTMPASEAQFAPESPGESEDALSDVASILSERPDERLAAQLGAAASHVEDLATFVRHAAEDLQALRAQRQSDAEGFELALRTEAFEKDQLARELSELRAETEALRVEAALERSRARAAEADRTALRAGINRAGDVLTRAALEGKIGEGLDAAGLAAELERLAWASVEKEKAGGGALRGALRDVIGELGGELPEAPTDEQLCVGAIDAASNALKAVTDLAGQVDAIAVEREAARSERDIAQGDARNMAGRVMRLRAFVAPLAELAAPHEATDHELIAAAEQHVLPLRAVAEGAIGELTGAPATSAKPIAEQLHEAVATFGPRAGDFSTELETAAVLAVHRLTGEPAPRGKGRVAIAEALTAAVEATAAKLAVRRMRVPGATPETDTQPKSRVVF